MDEIWKDVSEYPDLFSVSNLGRVYSKRTDIILSQGTTKTGYKVISSRVSGRNGKAICKKVHRWVAEAFISNPDNKPFVNHIDGDKANNHVDNLEWCTNKENAKHAYEILKVRILKGEEIGNSKLTEDNVRHIREMYASGKYLQRELAEIFGVGDSVVNTVIKRKAWKHVK